MKKKAKELEQAKAGLSKKDMLLWIFLSFFLALALYLNYNYSQYSLPVRLLGWLMVLAVALPVALMTQKGRDFYEFVQLAYIELVKVVWPGRQEVGRMTMMVAVVVVAASILLWLIDSAFLWGIRHVS